MPGEAPLTCTTDYGILVTATVMVHIDAAERSAADAILASLKGAEFDLPASDSDAGRDQRTVRELTFTALTLESATGELSTVNGIPLEDICTTDGCDEPTADGEGYDGECGSCADRTYATELCVNNDCDEWLGDSAGPGVMCDDCAELTERDVADRLAA